MRGRSVIALLLIAALSGGCATLREKAPEVPSITSILTVDQAEKALYVATKAYEFSMTQINRQAALGRITPQRHAELVGYGEEFRHYATIANYGIQHWRKSGTKLDFAEPYQNLTLTLTLLEVN